MATPKKRTGKAAQASRRANWKGSIPATTTCPNCKAIIPTHTICPECGYYKNGFVSIKKQQTEAEAAVSSVESIENKPVETALEQEEPKKTRKPRAKKAAAEETSQEVKEETKEEVKQEAQEENKEEAASEPAE